MPIISYEEIEGGQKGQTVARATNLAINKFFSLGVTNIQNECNGVAKRYSALWNTKPSEQKMSEFDVTYAQGKSEIQQDFELFEPSTIYIKIFNCYCPLNRNAGQWSNILGIILSDESNVNYLSCGT